MMMCTRWEPCSDAFGEDGLGEHVVFQRFAENLLLAVAEPGVLGEMHYAFDHIVVDGVGVAFGHFPVFAMRCSNVGRLAVDDGFGEQLFGERDFGLIGGELPLIHGNFYIAAKYPVAVVEVQARGLRLVGGHRHVALRDPHLAK